ncbi:hypothetical protein LI249_14750 [Dorea formicigenerans]|jgi:hypothetical protein|nr:MULTISPECIES: hypothetical protein [Dorea]MCC3185965.1 hypothetical protein [[Clostridium] innocuum]MCB6284357.1 hypothetical protein [Dorea formicigenerans]MCB6381763.1 hypothetical protein [Dorea formicigenerans]MCB6384691.1 hypothetical protein [Dorea formicigenerans]MCB6389893.1 hypothetical protein [Dorea formicigenerans]
MEDRKNQGKYQKSTKWEKRWQQAEEIEAFKHKFKIEYSKAINAIVL